MKTTYRLILPTLLLTTSLSTEVFAEDLNNASIQSTPNAGGFGTSQVDKYLLRLGAYLGYDLSNDPKADDPASTITPVSSAHTVLEQALIETVLGAMPVNALSNLFIPTDKTTAFVGPSINNQANATFSTYGTPTQAGTSSTPTKGGSDVTVNPLIDQLPYQQDPVSQAILNILGTPDLSYCLSKDSPPQWTGNSGAGSDTTASLPYPKCDVLYGSLITNSIIAQQPTKPDTSSIPGTSMFFSSAYNQPFLSQLNANTLIAPLWYSTTPSTAQGATPNSTVGLTAQNQAQTAANFIRYASGAVIPLALPSRKVYDDLFIAATSGKNDVSAIQAQTTLATYLASLRVYAAQSSVALSNLYYILSKRLTQNDQMSTSNNALPSSQALSEYTMATWRLFNTDPSQKEAWSLQINKASSATVQKEMVTLLAEINYQLYLTRQQEERMLLTNSMLLLLSAHSLQPNANALSSHSPSSISP